MAKDPEKGLKNIDHDTLLNVGNHHAAMETTFWQLNEHIPDDTPWPVWTNRHKNFLIEA